MGRRDNDHSTETTDDIVNHSTITLLAQQLGETSENVLVLAQQLLLTDSTQDAHAKTSIGAHFVIFVQQILIEH